MSNLTSQFCMNALQMKLTKVPCFGSEKWFSHDWFHPLDSLDAATCVVKSFNVVLEGYLVPQRDTFNGAGNTYVMLPVHPLSEGAFETSRLKPSCQDGSCKDLKNMFWATLCHSFAVIGWSFFCWCSLLMEWLFFEDDFWKGCWNGKGRRKCYSDINWPVPGGAGLQTSMEGGNPGVTVSLAVCLAASHFLTDNMALFFFWHF